MSSATDAAARALVGEMTLDEKLECLDGDTDFWEGLADLLGGGYHEHTFDGGSCPRLGVPGIRFSDGPRGVVIGAATCFPVSMARAATWDTDLERRIGDAIGRELRAVGATFYGGVCVNLLRHPAWGRAQETYGEDPYLLGEMGAALARGAQQHVMACVKHFALNSMENARFQVDVSVDERVLHEVYLPHFRRVVDEGVAAVMSAYNSVNGEWCGQHRRLLTDVLRGEWGFEGMVVSDFIFGLRDAATSVSAGLDLEMPFRMVRHQHLRRQLAEGLVTEAEIDAAVIRSVATQLRFQHLDAEPRPPRAVLACSEHRALAREAATKSIVLLHNDGVLPLDARTLRRVAVVGRLAAVANLGDRGSSRVNPPEVVTPLDGLRAALEPLGVEVVHDDGSDLARAAALAARCDVTVVVVGYTHAEEGEYVGLEGSAHLQPLYPPQDERTGDLLRAGFERAAATGNERAMGPGGDRTSLRLPAEHEALVDAVTTAAPRVVVAVMSGSAVVMPWVGATGATLMLWYPGMEGGHALAEVLLGSVAPSGRLPFTVPTDEAHLPHFDRSATAVVYDRWHGYTKLRRDGVAPHFPFGFGLTYTTFELHDPTVSEGSVQISVTNTGRRTADHVVQVYGGLMASEVVRAHWLLVGFVRVESIAPGETRRVTVPVHPDLLAVRRAGGWWTEPGDYRFCAVSHGGELDLHDAEGHAFNTVLWHVGAP